MKLGEGTTPGPWISEALPRCKVILKTKEDLLIAAMIDEPNRSRNQAESNARLIAKAPLLIECRDVLERAEEQFTIFLGEHGLSGDNNPTVKAIRALLAKLES